MKKILTKTVFTSCRNAEHVQVHTNIVAAITEAFATKYGILAPRNEYVAKLTAETDYFQPNSKYKNTVGMKADDGTRDNGFYLVANVVDAIAKFSLDPEMREAAAHLREAIESRRDAASKSYAEETAALSDIYEKLMSEEYSADVAKLHLTNAVAAAKAANDDFNEKYVAKADEILERKTRQTMKELRPATDAAFRELAESINALYNVNAVITKDSEKEEELGAVIDDVNALLVQFDSIVRTRLNKGSGNYEDAEKDPETPAEPTEPTEPGDDEEVAIPHP